MERLETLLKKVVADIAKVQIELEVRKAKFGGGTSANGDDKVFENEKIVIRECDRIIAKLEGTVC